MNVLTIIFICIFVATAIITLASLPGWIKIPDGYRKALFSALLLEVIGCVIVLFRNEQSGKIPEISHSDFIALNTKGQVVQLAVNQQIIGLSSYEFEKEARKYAHYELQKEQSKFVVKTDSVCLGSVSTDNLKDVGLFNHIDAQSSAFEYVKFTQATGGKWNSNKKFPMLNLLIEVNDSGYEIFDDKKLTTYASGNSFNMNDRNLHFFHSTKENDENCYLVRMVEANLNPDRNEPYATFFILRFKPSVNTK